MVTPLFGVWFPSHGFVLFLSLLPGRLWFYYPPMGDKTTTQPFFLDILDPLGGFIPPGGGFVTSFRRVFLSPRWVVFIMPGGGRYHPWG